MSSYTVGELAKLSGVSVATLHHYDSKGLLKPLARTREGQYRFYEQKELLRLQQILFYKELGFSLLQIKKILNQKGFELLTSLQTQKKMFLKKIDHSKSLVKTIDLTMKHLEESIKMEDKQFFIDFKKGLEKSEEYREFMCGEEQKEVEGQSSKLQKWSKEKALAIQERLEAINARTVANMIKKGLGAQEVKELEVLLAAQNSKFRELPEEKFSELQAMLDGMEGFLEWPHEKRVAIQAQVEAVEERFVALIEKGLSVDSQEVQALVSEHYKVMCQFWESYGKEDYINDYKRIAKLYQHPDYVDRLGKVHPQLADFLSKAMTLWAN